MPTFILQNKGMKYFTLIMALLAFGLAGAQTPTYSRVKISGTEAQLKQLPALGLLDHFHHEKNGIIAELETSEIDQLKQAGYAVETLISDMGGYYSQRLTHMPKTDKAGECGSQLDYTDPTNFNLGSMGGYLTYTEILAELDAMAAQYPSIFKAKAPISNFMTHENRPLYWVKISDNAGTDENEPRVLFNSLIHAREGVSVMQLVYFMWYVLENYNTNAEIKFLVDNSEMYFIPVVNPDGYIYNETLEPNGGGMHRKNKRPTGGNNPGVDLNRNFGYQWGVSGSSNNVTNDTYRGPSAFSEPETQAFKWFAEQYGFTAAFTHHSYANLLLWPYGYADVQTADNALYAAVTAEMVTESGFVNEQSVDLYPAAGDTDDWMYTATPEKPKVLAMTPETGNDDDGFWPAQNRILPICRHNLKMNLDLVRLVVKYGISKATGNNWIHGTAQRMPFNFKRFGLQNGNFTVTLQSLSAQATVTGPAVTFTNPAHMATLTDSIAYTVAAGTPNGTELKFVLVTDNGFFLLRDTVTRIYGNGNVILADGANNMTNWTSNGGSWGTTASTFVSAPTSITDSPTGNYGNNAGTGITLTNPVNLLGAQMAQLHFWTKWNIEAGYDYVQLQISIDNGGSWIPLCGKYTKNGTANQTGAEGEPLYDGVQNTWVMEEISLNDYVGAANVKFRFILRSDQGENRDGFYFDDFTVETITDNSSVTENAETTIRIFPNPTTGSIFVSGLNGVTDIRVLNTAGQNVSSKQVNVTGSTELFLDGLANGIYFVNISTGGRYSTVKISLHR